MKKNRYEPAPGMLHLNADGEEYNQLISRIKQTIAAEKKVKIFLDFDDTMILLDQTRQQKRPVLNKFPLLFLATILKKYGSEYFELSILSARSTDECIKKNHPELGHALIQPALTLFLNELTESVGQPITLPDDRIHCLNGRADFPTYKYNVYVGVGINSDEYVLGYSGLYVGKNANLPELYKLQKQYPNKSIKIETYEIPNKACFLTQHLESDSSFCIFLDDQEWQITGMKKIPELREKVFCIQVEPTPETPVQPLLQPLRNAFFAISTKLVGESDAVKKRLYHS